MMAAINTPPGSTRRLGRWFLGGAILAALVAGLVYVANRPRASVPTPPGENLDGLERDVAEVIRGARSLVLDDLRSASAWGRLGEVFLANEMDDEGGQCFAQAERLDPTDPRWPYFLGGTILNHGEWADALPFLRRAVALSEPEQTAPRLLLGETLTRLGQVEEAEGVFREVLARHPEDPRALFNRGLLAIARQDWKAAHELFLRCIGSPFARQRSRIQLALVCGRLGDLPAAAAFHTQVQRLPKDIPWLDSFAEGYMRWAVKKRNRYRHVEQLEAARRFAEAVVVLEPLAERYPDDYVPLLAMGKMLGQTGDLARAEACLRKALQLAPDKVQIRYYLGLVLFLKGEALSQQKPADPAPAQSLYRESVELSRQALRAKPDYGFAHMSLGLALKRLGEWPEAIASLRQAILCDPEYAETHFYLGETLAERGHVEEARSRLEHALRIAEPQAPWRQAATARLDALPKPGPK